MSEETSSGRSLLPTTPPSASGSSGNNSFANPTNRRHRLANLTPSPSTPSSSTKSSSSNPTPVDDKIFSKYSNILLAESNKRKIENADHLKRLAELRKELKYLEETEWMYPNIEDLLGK